MMLADEMIPMVFVAIDPTATATWGGVVAMVVIFGLDKTAAYLRNKNKSDASVVEAIGVVKLQIEKQNTAMERNHGENKSAYSALGQKVDNISVRLEQVASGDTPHVASSNALIAQHEHTLENHSGRIVALEIRATELDSKQKNGLDRVSQVEGTLRRCVSCREADVGK